MRRRVIVVPIITNPRGELLLCKMSKNRGVFPGQWGLAGGGIEEGESMIEALHREVREELGISVTDVKPWSFRDDVREKQFPDGRRELLYLIYLMFRCRAAEGSIRLNDEFETHEWVPKEQLSSYDLNEATQVTFTQMGLL